MIFDGDDTLWVAEALYDAALDRAATAVERAGLSGDEWRSLQREIDLRNVRSMGMSPDRFPLSSQEALLRLADRHGVVASDELMDEVQRASVSVFAMKAQVVDNAERSLGALAPHFHLALLTKGDETVQRKRIDDSGLEHHFEQISIVANKTEQSFLDLAAQIRVEPGNTWSVGNSLASDVNPALRVGMNAIWIDAHVWEHERRESLPAQPHLIVLDELWHAVGVLLAQVHAREPC